MSMRLSSLLPLFVAGLVAGCLEGTELVTPPREQPSSFVLHFTVDVEDEATASALGWGKGVPGVLVTIAAEGSTNGSDQVSTGTDEGTLTLEQLAAGRYSVDAVRWLTAEERSRLPAGDDAVGFLARVPLVTSSSAPDVPIKMVASRRRGLVLSEWHRSALGDFSGAYEFGGYIRLYNNADTTVYLDGVVVGLALAGQFDNGPIFPCSSFQGMSQDQQGVWARSFHQLPGRGSDFPLLPGQTAVVATDAIDHGQLVADGLDLRTANFELQGTSDVDNPSVPNAPEVGLYSYFKGHGIYFNSLANVVFVSLALDTVTLQRGQIPPQSTFWVRIPKERLLEVVAIATTYISESPECERMVHPSFDRLAVKVLGYDDRLMSLRRRTAPFDIAGRKLLQHTRTSAWDFTAAPRQPFATP